jgi:MFS family permease
MIMIAPLRGTDAVPRRGPGFLSVVRTIWLPGFGAALSSVGFGAIAAFGSLLFAGHHWTPVWPPFSAYAVALIGSRLMFGDLPDRIGGARVALGFVLVEIVGLAAMGFAAAGWIAALGAALTGFGYALVFPALGVEAVRRAPPERRGVAMGAYTACLDLALGVSGPLLGLIAGSRGIDAVFLTSMAVVLGTVPIALLILRARRTVNAGGIV